MPEDPADVSWREAVRGAAALLADAGVPSPDVDARLLAEHVLAGPLVTAERPGPDQLTDFAALVDRRRRREPLQHLTGEMFFRHLRLVSEPGAFVVRPETEMVAEEAITAARQLPAPRVVDLCTGSGAIALAVATEVPTAAVWAVELSPQALAVAARNVADLAPHVTLVPGDAATALPELDGTVDVVVSNPPYVPPDAVPHDPEVRDHDPDLALYGGGTDGLDVPRAVLLTAARLLRPGGTVVMEHAEVQAAAARAACVQTGAFSDVRTVRDLTGRDRMVVARRG
ncbi:release factor glutamine methyltransferase [Georgenia satyanarayanai]|uniref:Release factor glutamine methyltransferase n=1 Tax=Georgenia satyanarayanai TaxID=860221 RepID=A0A2Y9A9H0_9MICO|nr:peptide chain release factor N(5)-glutamine methyltransferase [Georgenia satyanarayanai]PYG00519.1 release factor glutamine methyltransferase [Georgenia satyanarayanai]SSA39908.1 release factor glutamine methyltransferase [Georgenia satyanarayanai]